MCTACAWRRICTTRARRVHGTCTACAWHVYGTQAPNFFMELKRGDFEDHAIYLANLLLGMNIDAYVCCGRLHTAKKGEKRHVWVMVREDDGCVRFWETSTGDDLEMKGRWRGDEKFMAKKREEEEKAEKAAEKEKEAANRGGGGGGGADADKKGGKGKKGGKKSRRRSTKKKGKGKEAAAAAAAAAEAEAETEAEAVEGEGEDDDDDERERGREQKLALWRRRKSGQGHDDVVDIEMARTCNARTCKYAMHACTLSRACGHAHTHTCILYVQCTHTCMRTYTCTCSTRAVKDLSASPRTSPLLPAGAARAPQRGRDARHLADRGAQARDLLRGARSGGERGQHGGSLDGHGPPPCRLGRRRQ